jgi:hypothetical protein
MGRFGLEGMVCGFALSLQVSTFPESLNPEGFKNLTSDFYEIEF